LDLRRHKFNLIPEGPLETAYVEGALGMRNDGDDVLLIRENCMGSSDLAHLSTDPFPGCKTVQLTDKSVQPTSIQEQRAAAAANVLDLHRRLDQLRNIIREAYDAMTWSSTSVAWSESLLQRMSAEVEPF
jgi:hypothetical protein